ncbi:MAG: right-handed parallel beta-helix repeat-containing protein [Planctomycetota bacterium]
MRRTSLKTPLVASILVLGLVELASGRTITVDDDGPADFNTIQAAIDDANDGDVVEIQPGIYTSDGNRDVNFAGKAITVRSTGPNDPNIVAATVIDCQAGSTNSHRAFNFRSGEGQDSVLQGLTIKNGFTMRQIGGGVLCEASSPTIVLCEASSPTIGNCIFYNNIADVGGPAGGAIAILAGSSPVITNCVFERNTGITCGGAIACVNSEAIIEGCTFIENYQEAVLGTGGAIHLQSATTTIRNCLFVGNNSRTGGGAIGTWYGTSQDTTIVNCTFVGNRDALNRGGAIYNLGNEQQTITNCIFWANKADQGANIYGAGGVTISYCDVEGGWDGPGVYPSGSAIDGGGNIDADPCFAELGYRSGPDPWDIWMAGDYHLQSGAGRWDPNSESWVLDNVTSPCIDKGDPNSPVGDEPDPNGARINIGVYGGTAQASKSPTCWDASACAGQPSGDANCDGVTNLADLYVLKAAFGASAPWTGHNCCADFGHDGTVNLADLFTLKANFGATGYAPAVGNQNCPP